VRPAGLYQAGPVTRDEQVARPLLAFTYSLYSGVMPNFFQPRYVFGRISLERLRGQRGADLVVFSPACFLGAGEHQPRSPQPLGILRRRAARRRSHGTA
jgi:hypothetical protein